MKKTGLIVLFSVFMVAACDSGKDNESVAASKQSDEAPVALVEENDVAMEKEVAVKVVQSEVVEADVKVDMSGEQVYKKSCIACHGSGAAGAPKSGDAAAWENRLSKGMEALYLSAINGVAGTAMMAKGTCVKCSDKELHAAVDYMILKLK